MCEWGRCNIEPEHNMGGSWDPNFVYVPPETPDPDTCRREGESCDSNNWVSHLMSYYGDSESCRSALPVGSLSMGQHTSYFTIQITFIG